MFDCIVDIRLSYQGFSVIFLKMALCTCNHLLCVEFAWQVLQNQLTDT